VNGYRELFDEPISDIGGKMRKLGFIIYPGYQPMGFAANRQAADPADPFGMIMANC
jgi:hypothetical protein